MKLYAITVSAVRDLGGATPEVTMHNVVALLPDDTSIDDAALDHARQALPESEGWADHQIIYTEIDSGHVFGAYRLTWSVEDVRDHHQTEPQRVPS